MIPSVLDDDDAAGGGSSSDILAEERERRLRRRRGFRALWLGNWLTGRAGVVFLSLFLVAGLGWLGFQRLDFSRSSAPGSPAVAESLPERVRDLTVSEYSAAARYGEPLHMGPEGLPVVRFESTARVRELTPFEMGFGSSSFSYLPSRLGRVVEVTGPRGWGMWWRDMSEESSLRPLVSFDRYSWMKRQERELARTVRGISLGLFRIGGLDLEFWELGSGPWLLRLASEIREPYPPARYGHWSAVPGLWFCNSALEADLHQGVTPGCPGDEYVNALRDAWFHAGIAVDRMEKVGRLAHRMDGMDSEELFQSNIQVELAHAMLDFSRDVRRLDLALSRLRQVSREWDLSISVNLVVGG